MSTLNFDFGQFYTVVIKQDFGRIQGAQTRAGLQSRYQVLGKSSFASLSTSISCTNSLVVRQFVSKNVIRN